MYEVLVRYCSLAFIVAAVLSACAVVTPVADSSGPFFDDFSAGDSSRRWTVTSGQLRRSLEMAWSDSGVFRAVTRRSDFRDFKLKLKLCNRALGSTHRTPAESWDGIHVFLRYQSQYHLYVATLNRRDNRVVIKKKVPGGRSNGGSYFELTKRVAYRVPYKEWQRFNIIVTDTPAGAVSIKLYSGDRLLLSALDDGRQGGAPIRSSGRVGIRGDNAQFFVDDFSVEPISREASSGPRKVARGFSARRLWR